MIAPALGVSAALCLAAAQGPPPVPVRLPASAGYWMDDQPADAPEGQLRQALAATRGSPVQTAEALGAVSAAHRGTATSGLAQLAAGLILLDAGLAAEAEPYLAHADVGRTGIKDHAAYGLGRLHERAGDFGRAAESYRALLAASPVGLRCVALLRGAELEALVGRRDDAAGLLNQALTTCPGSEPQALLQLGLLEEKRGDPQAAAAAFDRVDRDYPATVQGKVAAVRLKALAPRVPALTPEERLGRELKKALVLLEGGYHLDAVRIFRDLLSRKPAGPNVDVIRVRLARSLISLKKVKEAQGHLAAVPKGSAVEPEAAYQVARLQVQKAWSPKPYESVADRFPGTSWGEEALLDLAHRHAREGRHAQALPYERRLLREYPSGRYAERMAWRVAWAEIGHRKYEEAATILEAAAKKWPRGSWTPGYLYWAGRARRDLGQEDAARQQLEEAVRRYKHLYHGLQARIALHQVLEGASSTHPAPPEGPDMPEPLRTRARQLILIGRLDEALDELRAAGGTNARAQATVAWIHARRGRLRPAINAMRRAYPEYMGVGGDRLPEPVWRILFPVGFEEAVLARARENRLDPALVAALINQESTFDPTALSAPGARGLMQIMVPTGRGLARARGIKKFTPNTLYDPLVNLDLGTRYFRQVLNSFGGRVERALAAYNAGPTRVAAWTAARPGMSAEEFIESIPFPETRTYVMTILSGREHYRRIYGLGASAP